jgi:anhydro-N-acetylmuramic acid kinase
MPSRWIIGLATGSSANCVDAVLLELQGIGLDLRLQQLHGLHQPIPSELRTLLQRVRTGPVEPREVSQLHRLLGETYASAARAVADSASQSLARVHCIGCAGYTVGDDPDSRFPSTLALGMSAVLAERCGVTVVSDFRSRDLAAGGQGTPLSALPDHVLFRHPRQSRLLLHLGSMSHLVYLPANGRLHEMIALEAGPCNLLLDALIQWLTAGKEAYDAGGKRAVQGRCVEPLLQEWLSHPVLQRRPPRCLPSQAFGKDFAIAAVHQIRQYEGGLHDLLCTATHFVARCISLAYKRFLPSQAKVDEVLLSGGGTRNGFLWHLLEQQFTGHSLARTDQVGIPAELRQVIGHALLAALTLDGVPSNVPGATGAAGSRLLGSLTPGSSANWARCLQWMCQQATVATPVLR